MTIPGRRRVAAVIALAAAGFVGRGLWIPTKAALAQALLERSWSRTVAMRAAGHTHRPWPWADTWPVARLRVPRLGIHRVVLAGASGRTLAFAPGHVDGTAAPGGPGNSGIAGHRDTNFAFLRRLEKGDELIVERPDGRMVRYQVAEARVVDRSHSEVLADTADDRLTLVTCWPFDAVVPGGPERYVVTALLE
jgi:sortase A